MFQIIEYATIQDFLKENKKVIYKNRLAHYHLIKYFGQMNAGKQSFYQVYNVIDNNDGNVIAVWGDSVYYLYSLKYSEDIVDGLLSKIEISKYTKRFTFCGTSQLIIDLFNKSGISYEVFKQRILYSCENVLPLNRKCKGAACFSTGTDLDTVAEMTYKYGVAEWGEREDRDLNYARKLSYQSIMEETGCNWEVDGKIVTIATVLDSDTELPIIGNLYTNETDRGKGYAKCLVHEIARQFTKDEDSRCGIVSDLSNPITNRMFLEVGFEEVSRYISVHTMREAI